MTIQSFAATTGPVLSASIEFVVVACADHGSTVTTDFETARMAVRVAHECARSGDTSQHARWHARQGHDCWVDGDCCVVDPYGMFD